MVTRYPGGPEAKSSAADVPRRTLPSGSTRPIACDLVIDGAQDECHAHRRLSPRRKACCFVRVAITVNSDPLLTLTDAGAGEWFHFLRRREGKTYIALESCQEKNIESVPRAAEEF